jgi:MscS family membrane protein
MLSENLNIAPITADFSKKRISSGKLVAVGNELGLKNTLFVNLSEFADSAIIIDIYAFSRSVDWGNWRETKEEVMFNIMGILEKNNLEFAFPSQSIYIENSIDNLRSSLE